MTMPYDRDDNFPDERLTSQCDACGEYKPDCEDVTYQGMDTHACAKCRACEDDEAADRGDFEFHRDYDQ
jgi:hypothetical protein